jgi:hypothetical protein
MTLEESDLIHDRDDLLSRRPNGEVPPRQGGPTWARWPFILILPLMLVSFSKPQTRPPFKDIIVWQAANDVVCANDRGDIDRSAAQFPQRFSKLPKGTEVVAVEAGGGIKRPILKLRTVKNETAYIYVDDFKRQFVVAKIPKK